MQEVANRDSYRALVINTLAFTVCFAVWMVNGVLVTFLVDNQVFDWSYKQMGFLMGVPVLTGSIFRLPAGILTDKYGGKPVYGILLFLCAIPMFLLSFANSFLAFALCSFGFGLAGISFSIGIAYTSVWFPKHQQGTALGIFGAGNAGAALTTLFAPTILNHLTGNGEHLDEWRKLPVYYAILLVIMGVIFFAFTKNKKPESSTKSLSERLVPLKHLRVWRFGLYYFLVFGGFVAFSQWLMPYFVNVYDVGIVLAGTFVSAFSFPSGVIRAFGGWLSDKFGARTVMYWVLGSSLLISILLIVPRMAIESPGRGIQAKRGGKVVKVESTQVVVDEVTPAGKKVGPRTYKLIPRPKKILGLNETEKEKKVLIFPTSQMWQVPRVKEGMDIKKKTLIAKGRTRIFFQANLWVFVILVVLLGSIWGIGKAAVYKHIPDYFPEDVGVVGGMVGVLGGLGGFFCPLIFGYLLSWTGLWTTCWVVMGALSAISLIWMHHVIRKMTKAKAPGIAHDFETGRAS